MVLKLYLTLTLKRGSEIQSYVTTIISFICDTYLSLGHLYELKSPSQLPIIHFPHIFVSIELMLMINLLIPDRVTLDTLS